MSFSHASIRLMDGEGMQARKNGDGRLVLKQREPTALIGGLWAMAAFTMEDVVRKTPHLWHKTTQHNEKMQAEYAQIQNEHGWN